ncbi:MAG TPA: nucleoside-triphosphatase [Bacteroidales bacterium]|nr:nucleoside-triphosphatase [Bacteroidales bacterium]HPI86195.1 nucleoside-triphosphatase [Bacteroidales bacterium]
MHKHPGISDKWIRASVIGTTWAASEIVLGSFLHNLRIPFSSNILAGIGIIALVSVSYKWQQKGLFWRAGLICALMKTMSPSAVIFGPMIAIFSQALMLEIFTRVLGRNFFGFAIGAMFATTWNLFQKIINFIIFYGFDIVDVYSGLLSYAQKQLNIRLDLVWSPVILLAIIYSSLGLVSAIIGMRIGRKLLSQEPVAVKAGNNANLSFLKPKTQSFPYSIGWLFLDMALIITAFILLNFGSWMVWGSGIIIITTIWVIRYKRALRQLARPTFWLYFVLITMGTAFVINRVQSREFVEGLIIGIQMNFRAALVILGFSVLGTELYNPRIREFFLRTSFKQLPMALELSFDSLPIMISAFPDIKEIVKSPVSVIYRVISQIDFRLEEIRRKLQRKVFIISGPVGGGKTTQIRKIIEELWKKNIQVDGIYSPRVMEDGLTAGYDVVDVETGQREPFLRKAADSAHAAVGQYDIHPAGLELGLAALTRSHEKQCRLVVIDEVGRLEVNDRGWSEKLALLIGQAQVLVLTVRDTYSDEVIKKWGLKDYEVFTATGDLYVKITDKIAGLTG